ncbi:MAG: type II toxin-antitoxin system RelE/ParE family toxin [Chitinispirillaceae bacterium]
MSKKLNGYLLFSGIFRCRLFYFHHKNKLYIVTSGYTKKQTKTEMREIERALRLMHEVAREG